jgi:hypothetical protein
MRPGDKPTRLSAYAASNPLAQRMTGAFRSHLHSHQEDALDEAPWDLCNRQCYTCCSLWLISVKDQRVPVDMVEKANGVGWLASCWEFAAPLAQ